MDYQKELLNNEKLLFSSSFCHNEDNLNKILHESFYEYGKSGTIITREETIDFLKTSEDRLITITEFDVVAIDTKTYIVHYISINEDGIKALRTSIWIKEDNNYRLYFHQGTPMKDI